MVMPFKRKVFPSTSLCEWRGFGYTTIIYRYHICHISFLLTELVSYMYPIYVHYMYILDVLSFPFGSRH